MEPTSRTLPENAYRPLKPGETYNPIVPAGKPEPEFTTRSLIMGVVMAAVFSAAAGFLCAKKRTIDSRSRPACAERITSKPIH